MRTLKWILIQRKSLECRESGVLLIGPNITDLEQNVFFIIIITMLRKGHEKLCLFTYDGWNMWYVGKNYMFL